MDTMLHYIYMYIYICTHIWKHAYCYDVDMFSCFVIRCSHDVGVFSFLVRLISCIPHVFVVFNASPHVIVVFSAAHLMYSSCFRFLECVSSPAFRMHKKFLVRLISCIPHVFLWLERVSAHVFRMHRTVAYAGAAMYSVCTEQLLMHELRVSVKS